jgi:glycine oxidase
MIVVIGAGVAGCAVAYYLAREGLPVTIVERESVAFGASGYAAGLLNPLTGTGVPGPMEAISIFSYQAHVGLWGELEERSGVDIQAELVPHLELILTEEDAEGAEELMARWGSAPGFSVEWLDADEVLKIEPRVNSGVLGAILLESPAALDSRSFTLALLEGARAHGAVLVKGEVTGVDDSRVMLRDREIGCDTAVLAAGPWASDASAWLGVDLPIGPLKGQIVHLAQMDPPLWKHLAGPVQIASKKDGLVWLGATEEHEGFDNRTTQEARDDIIERAVRMVPSLAGQPVVGQTSCLRPVAPDRLPIVGTVPGREGVYIAAAPEKKGIMIGPAIGLAIADLIVRGETSVPIENFSLSRFL